MIIKDYLKTHQTLTIIIFVLILITPIILLTINSSSDIISRQKIELLHDHDIGGAISYKNALFDIYSEEGSNKMTINAYSGYRNSAIEKVIEYGEDPVNYKITFTNYNNTFESYEKK